MWQNGKIRVSGNNTKQATNSFFEKKTTRYITRNKKYAGGSVAIGKVSYIGQYAGDNPGIPSSFRLEVGRETYNLTYLLRGAESFLSS